MPDNIFEEQKPSEPSVIAPEDNEAMNKTIEELKARGVDELAKGKAHADQFIEFLKDQNESLKEDLEGKVNAEKLIEELKNQKEVEPKVSEEGVQPTGLNPEDIQSLVKDSIEQSKKEENLQHNVGVADQKVKEIYGDKANEFMTSKAQELGLSLAYLGDVAATSPDAFFKMVGLEGATAPVDQAPSSSPSINTEALADQSNINAVKPGTYRYYSQLRRDNPGNFYTAKVQQQLFKDRERLGEEFNK